MRRVMCRWTGPTPLSTEPVSGACAEKRALKFLQRQGLRLVRRNFRCRFGEIDIIMQDRNCLAIVEVRSRGSAGFESPALTVDEHKQQKIARTTLAFQAQSVHYRDWPIRFDVIAILGTDSGPGAIQWIQDAFRA